MQPGLNLELAGSPAGGGPFPQHGADHRQEEIAPVHLSGHVVSMNSMIIDQPSKARDDQHEPQRQGFSVFPWSAVQAGTLILRREVKETKACCIFLSNHPLHLIA